MDLLPNTLRQRKENQEGFIYVCVSVKQVTSHKYCLPMNVRIEKKDFQDFNISNVVFLLCYFPPSSSEHFQTFRRFVKTKKTHSVTKTVNYLLL